MKTLNFGRSFATFGTIALCFNFLAGGEGD